MWRAYRLDCALRLENILGKETTQDLIKNKFIFTTFFFFFFFFNVLTSNWAEYQMVEELMWTFGTDANRC